MVALLRQGAKRIGGSVLQRTQAAVTPPAAAEERRLLVPRRMTTVTPQQVQQKKEELYEVLSQVEGWGNRGLLQTLAAEVNPRPDDTQWRRLRASKRATNVVKGVATVSFGTAVAIGWDAWEGRSKAHLQKRGRLSEALVK